MLAATAQIENEYGHCGSNRAYLRHLLRTARQLLGVGAILFTTDPPDIADLGSLPGDEVLTCAAPGARIRACAHKPAPGSQRSRP